MGRGRRRGPKPLRFSALLNGLGESIDLIADQRLPERVKYPLQDCYRSGFGLFYVQDPSLLEFQRRFQEETQRNNLSTVFGVEAIPADSQFRDVLDTHDYEPLRGVFAQVLPPASTSETAGEVSVLPRLLPDHVGRLRVFQEREHRLRAVPVQEEGKW